jgi:flagellar hook-associated protein 2
MATTSTNFISALGGGSGIDVKALAQGLVDAEKVPQKGLLDKKIAKSEARISGLGAINFIVKELKSNFSNLEDQGDFSSLSINNTQPTAMTVATGSTASQ